MLILTKITSNSWDLTESFFSEWEKEWKNSQTHPNFAELLIIFPESKEYLSYRLKEFEQKIKSLTSDIIEDLKRIYKKTDEFTLWFLEEIVRIWKGERLNFLDKEVRKLRWLLYPPKESKGITDEQIQRARECSLPQLLGLPTKPKQMVKCPFHSEKHGSFWITQNNDGTWFAYCFGGCGWHGDTIKFLQKTKNMTFVEAVEYLQ